jgi:hypothetical protein
MQRLILFLPIYFVFFTSVYSQEPPNEKEFNIWSDASVTIPIVKGEDKSGKSFDKINIFFNTTLRLGRDSMRPIDERVGVGMNFRVNKYITLTPDIFYQAQQPTAFSKGTQTRFRFAVSAQNKWSKFSISDRNQIEYRLRNNQKDDVRYKNLIRLNVPINKDNKEVVTFFTSNEPYYNITTKKFTRNELFIGFSKTFNKNFKGELYYLLMNDRSFPKTVNGVGVNFKFRVD